jgi:hypothetical protein
MSEHARAQARCLERVAQLKADVAGLREEHDSWHEENGQLRTAIQHMLEAYDGSEMEKFHAAIEKLRFLIGEAHVRQEEVP